MNIVSRSLAIILLFAAEAAAQFGGGAPGPVLGKKWPKVPVPMELVESWRDVVLSRAAEKSKRKKAAIKFVKSVEARVDAPAPVWWAKAVVASEARKRDRLTSFSTLPVVDSNWVQFLRSVKHFHHDPSQHRLTIAANRKRLFVGQMHSFPSPFKLSCIDLHSRKIIWTRLVRADADDNAITLYWGAGCPHKAEVTIVKDQIVVFGCFGWLPGGGFYIESFDIKTGKPVLWFRSNDYTPIE